MTYQDLSQLGREENEGKSLTTARKDLYKAMADLLTRMQKEYVDEMTRDSESIMSEGAALRKRSAESLVKQITNTRTKKVCARALNAADGGNPSLEALTNDERILYEKLVVLFKDELSLVDRMRNKKVTIPSIDGHVPVVEEDVSEPVVEEPVEIVKPAVKEQPVVEEPKVETPVQPAEEEMFEESFDDIPEMDDMPVDDPMDMDVIVDKPVELPKNDVMVLRVLEDLPPFVGPDRNYELRKEDIITLPTEMAKVLINSQKAVAVTPEL